MLSKYQFHIEYMNSLKRFITIIFIYRMNISCFQVFQKSSTCSWSDKKKTYLSTVESMVCQQMSLVSLNYQTAKAHVSQQLIKTQLLQYTHSQQSQSPQLLQCSYMYRPKRVIIYHSRRSFYCAPRRWPVLRRFTTFIWYARYHSRKVSASLILLA